jgi:hypothetical protein
VPQAPAEHGIAVGLDAVERLLGALRCGRGIGEGDARQLGERAALGQGQRQFLGTIKFVFYP